MGGCWGVVISEEAAQRHTHDLRFRQMHGQDALDCALDEGWRLGTFIQCESVTLSRNVPFGLSWIIKPFLTQVPKETLTLTLQRTKSELLKHPRTKP